MSASTRDSADTCAPTTSGSASSSPQETASPASTGTSIRATTRIDAASTIPRDTHFRNQPAAPRPGRPDNPQESTGSPRSGDGEQREKPRARGQAPSRPGHDYTLPGFGRDR